MRAALQGILYLIVGARGIVVPDGLNAIVFLVSDAVTLVAVLVANAVMARWERRKLTDYGLPGRNAFGRKFWEGSAFGFAGVSLLVLLIFLLGGYSRVQTRDNNWLFTRGFSCVDLAFRRLLA